MTNGWDQHERVVLYRLNELKEGLDEVQAELHSLRIEVAMLKVKSGAWGATAGLIPVLILVLVTVLTGNVG